MNTKTFDYIKSYYAGEITSQKLIAYLKKFEKTNPEELYIKYHGVSNICAYCNNKLKYTGFKVGFRCTVECFAYKRSIESDFIDIYKHPVLSKKVITNNITKQGFLSRKFLKDYDVTEYDCYTYIYGVTKCAVCSNNSRFISFKLGYSKTCNNRECINAIGYERRQLTVEANYGVSNVSKCPKVILKKLKTFKHNNKVDNIAQLPNVYNKIRKTNENTGRWIKQTDLSELDQYRNLVRKYTQTQDINSLENSEKRGPVEKGGYHLDHMLSITDGFRQQVPIHIIGGIHNLKFIPALENISKGGDSSITLEELLEFQRKKT